MKMLELLINYILKNGLINEVKNADIDIPMEGGKIAKIRIEHMTTKIEKD